MALIVETGAGIPGADAWASIEAVDEYWLGRQHRAQAAAWYGLAPSRKEGCIREATAFLDSLDEQYRGQRRGWAQGLCWPRTDAYDDSGYNLPDVPPQLISATAELAAQAIGGELRPALAAGQSGNIKSASAGSVSVTFMGSGDQQGGGSSPHAFYTRAMDYIAPLLEKGGWAFA